MLNINACYIFVEDVQMTSKVMRRIDRTFKISKSLESKTINLLVYKSSICIWTTNLC